MAISGKMMLWIVGLSLATTIALERYRDKGAPKVAVVGGVRRPAQAAVLGRRLAFWGAVAGVAVLANFGLELVADRVPSLGLNRFVAYAHKGKG